jgi:hypothetical protein
MDQPSLFSGQDQKPDYVDRSSEKKKPVEWQADQFAAILLMPRELVKLDTRRNFRPLRPSLTGPGSPAVEPGVPPGLNGYRE